MIARTFKRFSAPLAVTAVLLCFSSPAAMAQASFLSDQGQFLALNPHAVPQEFSDGNTPPAGSFLQCDTPVSNSSDDACFQPGDILEGISFTQSPAAGDNNILLLGEDSNSSENPAWVLVNNNFANAFEIDFDPGARAAGMNIGCVLVDSPCNASVKVDVYGESGLLGSTTVAITNNFDTFTGVMTAEPITRILLQPSGSVQEVRGLLNIWFDQSEPGAEPGGPGVASIPVLSEWGMIVAAAGFALVGAFYAVRRRKASAD